MKESQARTKVVLRHLPPSISQAALLEHVDSKFAGCYSWFSFRPGKASIKRQVLSRAYINFKKPEDVYDFYEDFDGHVFVNEKGTQYKVTVEYAPYQRIPKPRSKKDIREGTITKDSDYLEFLEMLGKPMEFLPSAEVQLERREAEKAAVLGAGGKETVVVTPLMEFVRQRRAAKAGTQRSMGSKLSTRAGGVMVVTSNLTSHKRGLERSRSGPLTYVSENAMSGLSAQKDFKEVTSRELITGQRREEQQVRKDREVIIEKRKKELIEGKEKRPVQELVSTVPSSKGNVTPIQTEISKEYLNVAILTKDSQDQFTDEVETVDEELSSSQVSMTGKVATTNSVSSEVAVGDVSKDSSKREIVKRKQLTVVKDKHFKDLEAGPTSPGQLSVGSYNAYNQRHRPPVSPRVVPASVQFQLATSSLAASSGEVSTGVSLSKLTQRRELLGKNSSKGALSPRDQHSPSSIVLLDQARSQQGSPQSDKGGKRPPRPQNIRLIGKEPNANDSEMGSLSSVASSSPIIAEEKLGSTSAESFSGTDRQDSRRVRNKDRPDRPVWTPRRRTDASQSLDPSSVPAAVSSVTLLSQASDLSDTGVKVERPERGHQRAAGKAAQVAGQNWVETSSGVPSDLGRSQPASGQSVTNNPVYGKARYVESSNSRASRGARALPGNVVSTLEHGGLQTDSDSTLTVNVDQKNQSALTRENGENHISAGADREKHKQDTTPVWNELTGGSQRRRERNIMHGSREGDGIVAPVDLSKTAKRGGNLALGANEKQVWVAVQKSGSAI